MDVRDYVKLLRKRWHWIVACIIIGLALAAGIVKTSTKMYTASTQIFVAASSANGTDSLNNGNTFVQQRVQSYTNVATSPDVTSPVVKQLKLKLTADQLASKISADAPLNKVLLNIHVTDASPRLAASIANAVSTRLITDVENIERVSAGSAESPVKLTLIQPAQVPGSPTSPNVSLDLAIGGLAGLLVGLALAVLRETLDTRVRTSEDINEHIGAAVLAAVPAQRRSPTSATIGSDDFGSRAEAIRQLRTNLQYLAVDTPPKLIAITSAMSGEGKSTTAVGLASAMAEAGYTVCLVDADLRRPTIARAFGLDASPGLTSILAGRAGIGDVLQPVSSNLNVITSGPIPPNPSELLASGHFRTLLRELAEKTDYVLIDTAPLLPVADGSEVASVADVTLLVVRARRTNRDQLRKAADSLTRVSARLGGVVLNAVSARESGTYYEYYSNSRPARRSARAR
ncbi:polysaccharide biosynthesis tyrosine autokinase [uncultured Jatrophihabitans sp.]|uniref:polysaccharide biosynthesis tyrosine autokinase n=1 Tax=uncultured Jatrophihabitans sp. TaxID=1610747 RepID=UPI0035CB077E